MSFAAPTTTDSIPASCPGLGSFRAKVLCINRDPCVADAIKTRMAAMPVDVLRARNGMQGYWLAITKRPALIITDLRMTNGHGGEIIESVKDNALTRSIPVIVLANHDDPELARHALRMGAAQCFHKPWDVEAILSAVSESLA